jgi:hypothetical protein
MSDDDMISETAIDCGAKAIATFNRRDFPAMASRFGIAVLSPGEALKRVKLL